MDYMVASPKVKLLSNPWHLKMLDLLNQKTFADVIKNPEMMILP